MQNNYGPNPQTIGGRKMIIQELYNHHNKLLNIKPTFKFEKPRPHVDAKKRKKGIKKVYNKDNLEETYETFRRAHNVKKGLVDSDQPATYHMLKKKKIKKQKQKMYTRNRFEDFLLKEHEIRLKNQKRRFRQIGKKQERKKNPNDPVSHPVKFFRKGKTDKKQRKDVNIDFLFSELNSKNKYGIPKDYEQEYLKREIKKRKKIVNSVKYKKRKEEPGFVKKAETVYEILNFKSTNENRSKKEDRFYSTIPLMEGDQQEDYDKLQIDLIDIIIRHRIYKEQELQDLFAQTVTVNTHSEVNDDKSRHLSELQAIFTNIKNELDMH